MNAAGLSGLVLVVTRPREQGEVTARALERQGAAVIRFPLLAIEAMTPTLPAAALQAADAVIFVSANAVRYGLPHLAAAGGARPGARVYAIGRATAAALRDGGLADVAAPAGADSESLLAMATLQQVAGQHIIVVRGIGESGGRTLIADTLTARGARVDMLECYVRRAETVPPAASAGLRQQLRDGAVHGLFAMSVETLDSLATNLPAIAQEMQGSLLVPHERVAEAARRLGFSRMQIVPPGDEALIQSLTQLKPELMANS